MEIEIQHYQYRDIPISLPTHYNKHDIILNGYRYDIKQCGLRFLKHKIESEELRFTVNGIPGLKFLENASKEDYTYLIGNMVKIDKRIYQEYLHSSVQFIEKVALLNRKYIDFKILKVYVDEAIFSKKLVIKRIRNKYNYTFSENKFNVFVKRLETLGKQMYISDDDISINIRFYKNESLLNDLIEINRNTNSESECIQQLESLGNEILSGRYPSFKLAIVDPSGVSYLETNVGKLPYSSKLEIQYEPNFYHRIFREIGKYIIISKRKNFV